MYGAATETKDHNVLVWQGTKEYPQYAYFSTVNSTWHLPHACKYVPVFLYNAQICPDSMRDMLSMGNRWSHTKKFRKKKEICSMQRLPWPLQKVQPLSMNQHSLRIFWQSLTKTWALHSAHGRHRCSSCLQSSLAASVAESAARLGTKGSRF